MSIPPAALKCPSCGSELRQESQLAGSQERHGNLYGCPESHKFDVSFSDLGQCRALLTASYSWTDCPSGATFLLDAQWTIITRVEPPQSCPCCEGMLTRYDDSYHCSNDDDDSNQLPLRNTPPTLRIEFQKPLQAPYERVLTLTKDHESNPQGKQWSVNTQGVLSPLVP